MTEVWKPIPGFEGLYEASDHGRVRSVDQIQDVISRWGAPMRRHVRGRVLSAYINAARGGYRYVNLRAHGRQHMRRVAVLVALTFIGPREKGHEVRHRNGVSADDRLCNLRYGTAKQNAADKKKHGTHIEGERHGLAKLTEHEVRRIKFGSETAAELAQDLGVHPGHINNIRRGVRWCHV